MRQIPFTKVQSVGNDFVLVEASDVEGLDYSALAQIMCARRFGVGSDGFLVVMPFEGDLKVRFFNPDGTEDFCGNGLRSAAFYGNRKGWCGESFAIRQLGMRVAVSVIGDSVTAVMPSTSIDPSKVPICAEDPLIDGEVEGIVGTAVTTGSTHFVVFVDQLPESPEFEEVSARIERSPIFPERTSVIWTKVERDDFLQIRIWERGVGETLGCGTGAVAAATVWSRKSGSVGTITVSGPGGPLDIFVKVWDARVKVTAEPKIVYSGKFGWAG